MSFQDAMSEHVGRDRLYSVESLAEETGINARTVQSYLGEGVNPGYVNFVKIMRVMPDSFKILALQGTGIVAIESEGPKTVCVGELHAGATDLANTIAQARADNIVDHREMITIRRHLWMFMSKAFGFEARA